MAVLLVVSPEKENVESSAIELNEQQGNSEEKETLSELEELSENTDEETIKKENGQETEKSEQQTEAAVQTAEDETIDKAEESIDADSQTVQNPVQEDEMQEFEPIEITLPYVIPGTDLVIEKIAAYRGIYIEDGSDQSVSNVAALVVRNSGSEAVEHAKIDFVQNGKSLEFEISALPAGAKIAVQESNKAVYEEGKHGSCSATVAKLQDLEMSEDKIKVIENADSTLSVENLTDKTIPCVRVFYKYYMADEGAYIGGITYTAKVDNLEPGECKSISSSHYTSGSSKVVMVRTYDTAE